MTYTQEQIAAIAAEFNAGLRAYLTPEQWAEMCRRNGDLRWSHPICPSHDFCDANVFMGDAMEKAGFEHDAESQEQADLWDAAWTLARKSWVLA